VTAIKEAILKSFDSGKAPGQTQVEAGKFIGE
jgi:hypothetical protein